ncbi:hypothetical protein Tco_0002670 [Tanacetum coccineum]
MTTVGTRAVVNTVKGKMNNALKKSRWVWRPKGNYMDHESKEKGSFILKKFEDLFTGSGSGDKGGNAEELVSTARPEVSTARPDIDAARQEDSVVEPRTPPTTTNVDDSSRSARSILTLKPLPTIDPKYKGKGVLKESLVNKVKRSDLDAAQIAKYAKIARLVHEKELAEMEREREERQRQDQASVDYIASLYDEVQAKMDASKYRHNQLNKKTFEEIQALYIKEQERDADFVPIGSERDEKMIDKINKKAAGMDEEEKSKRQKTNSDLEEDEQLRASLKIVLDEDEEIDYEVLGMRYPIVNKESAFYHTDRYGVPHDYYRVFRANGNDEIWKNQEKWIIKSWTFYENYGVYILALEDGTKIHMLAERRYPLIRETLERMMELRLTVESEGEAIFDLLRFIQK